MDSDDFALLIDRILLVVVVALGLLAAALMALGVIP